MIIVDKMQSLSEYINRFTGRNTYISNQKETYYLVDKATGNKWSFEYLSNTNRLVKKSVVHLIENMVYSKKCTDCCNCVNCNSCRNCKNLNGMSRKVGLSALLRSRK